MTEEMMLTKIKMCAEMATIQAKFEKDIVEKAIELGLDPKEELRKAIRVMQKTTEDGGLEEHVSLLLKEMGKDDENSNHF